MNIGTKHLGIALVAAALPALQEDRGAIDTDVGSEVARIEALAAGQSGGQDDVDPREAFRRAVRDMVRQGQYSKLHNLGSSAADALAWTVGQQQPAELAKVDANRNALQYLIEYAPLQATNALMEMLASDPEKMEIFWVHADQRSSLYSALDVNEGLRAPFQAFVERVLESDRVSMERKVELAGYALPYTNGETAIDSFLFDNRSRWTLIREDWLLKAVRETFIRRTGELLEELPNESVRFALSSSVEAAERALKHPSAEIRSYVAGWLESDVDFGPEIERRAVGWMMELSADRDPAVAAAAIEGIGSCAARTGTATLGVEDCRTLLRRAAALPRADGELVDLCVRRLLRAFGPDATSPTIEGVLREVVAEGHGRMPERISYAMRSMRAPRLPVLVAGMRLASEFPGMESRRLLSELRQELSGVPGTAGADRAIEAVVAAGLSADDGRNVLNGDRAFLREVSPAARARLLWWFGTSGFDDFNRIVDVVEYASGVSDPLRDLARDETAPLRSRLLGALAMLADAAASPGDVEVAASAVAEAVRHGGHGDVLRAFGQDLAQYASRRMYEHGRYDEMVIGVFAKGVDDLDSMTRHAPSRNLRAEALARAVVAAEARRAGGDDGAVTTFLRGWGDHVLAGVPKEGMLGDHLGLMLELMEHHDDDDTMDAVIAAGADWLELARKDFARRPVFGASYQAMLKVPDVALVEEIVQGALKSGDTNLIQHVTAHVDAMVALRRSLSDLKKLETR